MLAYKIYVIKMYMNFLDKFLVGPQMRTLITEWSILFNNVGKLVYDNFHA